MNVNGGVLRMALRKEFAGSLDYTAGGVNGRQAFGYGYCEARVKMPRGRGWHTSFWMVQNGLKTGLEDRFQEIDAFERGSAERSSCSIGLFWT